MVLPKALLSSLATQTACAHKGEYKDASASGAFQGMGTATNQCSELTL